MASNMIMTDDRGLCEIIFVTIGRGIRVRNVWREHAYNIIYVK